MYIYTLNPFFKTHPVLVSSTLTAKLREFNMA